MIIEFPEAVIDKFVAHRVSTVAGGSVLSDALFPDFSTEEQVILKNVFLKPFAGCSETFAFYHDVDISLNALRKISNDIDDDADFLEESIKVHDYLKSVSKHPNIKDGDLFVMQFQDLSFNGHLCRALGIFKIENKESFVEVFEEPNGSRVGLNFRKGIGKMDKACLILFTDVEPTVLVVDKTNPETDYWQHEFLKVKLRKDNINSTTQFLSMTKSFVTDQYPKDFESNKTDQIELLNRSVNYFKKNDSFSKPEFEREVLQDAGIIESFREFNSDYRSKNRVEMADEFEISNHAVRKQARFFKSVLKLDKNFHIYIHGARDQIEQGMDSDGRKFYKIYYKEEY
jgi:hypothetical protein